MDISRLGLIFHVYSFIWGDGLYKFLKLIQNSYVCWDPSERTPFLELDCSDSPVTDKDGRTPAY
jgi:hypothetical protein